MRMIHRLAISVLPMLAVSVWLYAGDGKPVAERPYPRLTFGVETSYAFAFLNVSHFNYISSDGDRRDEKTVMPGYTSNGQILAGVGINLSAKVNLSMYTGYCGVYHEDRLIPLTFRTTWLSGDDPMKNRWMVFCSGGIGFIDPDNPSKLSVLGKAGAGYRVSLNRSVKLDFLLAFQETYTHPNAYESDVGNFVP